MPPGDDDVTIFGEFRDAISTRLERVAQTASETARDLDKVAIAGEAAAVGMDRSSIAAGRLKRQLDEVDRAAERKRMTDLRAIQVETEIQRIRSKGVVTQVEAARIEMLETQARRDAIRAATDLRNAHIALGQASEGMGRRILRAAGDVEHLTTGFRVLRGLALVEFFSSLAAGVGSLGAELVAGAAGLAPLLGVVGGLPALGLAAVSTAGSLNILTGGAGKAFGAMVSMGPGSAQAQQAISGLGMTGRIAAGEMTGVAAGLHEIRDEAARAGLPYLRGTMQNLQGLLPSIRRGTVETVSAVGSSLERITGKIRSLSGDVGTILHRNARLIDTLGDAGAHGVGVLDKIMLGAGGMVQGLAEDVRDTLGNVERYLTANPEKVEAFFDRVQHRVEGVAHVLKQWGVGIVNIFRGATPMVDHMGGSFTEMADRFAEWTGSDEGQQKITRFFRDAIPLASSIAHLVGEIGKGLGHLATASGGQGFASTINGIAALIGPLTDLLTLIDKIITKIPGGGTLAALFAIGMGLPTPFGRLPGVGPAGMARGVKGLFGFGRNTARGWRGAEGAYESVGGRLGGRLAGMLGGGAAAAGEGGALAEGAAGLGMLGPIGLAVGAGVGLGVLGGELYQHWKPFHNLVDAIGHGLRDAFGWVRDHGKEIGEIALAAFSPITVPIRFVLRHLDDIKDGLASVGKFIMNLPGMHTAMRIGGWLGSHILGLYTGGPVMPGGTYLTGELGPELLVSPSGMRVLGGDGAEILQAREPGFVLPHESLVAALDAIPSASIRAQAGAAVPLGGGGGGTAVLDDVASLVRQIGPFYGTQNEAEVRGWVRDGISAALAERDRRRRDRR